MSGLDQLTHENNMQILVAFIKNSAESKQTKIKLVVEFPPAPLCILSASKIIIVLLFKRFIAFYTAFKTPQPSAKAKMSKIKSETLISGDYLLLQKCSN